ncbi:MAG: endolytic transglycosylase MltG, partial [Rubrobacter sp.]|nr:endolytic transglycosylase MltG [Rubrobacter sp.]
MRRYNRRKAKDWEELEARLDAIVGRPASARRRKKRRSGRPLAGLLLLAGVLAVIYAIFAAATGGDEARAEPVKIRVAKGDTLSGVAERLEEKGVIGSSFLFELEARLEGKSTAIKPGEYTFRPGEDDDRILARLTAGQAAPTFTVTIPEGLTIEQTARRVARASGGDITVEEFERAAR